MKIINNSALSHGSIHHILNLSSSILRGKVKVRCILVLGIVHARSLKREDATVRIYISHFPKLELIIYPAFLQLYNIGVINFATMHRANQGSRNKGGRVVRNKGLPLAARKLLVQQANKQVLLMVMGRYLIFFRFYC